MRLHSRPHSCSVSRWCLLGRACLHRQRARAKFESFAKSPLDTFHMTASSPHTAYADDLSRKKIPRTCEHRATARGRRARTKFRCTPRPHPFCRVFFCVPQDELVDIDNARAKRDGARLPKSSSSSSSSSDNAEEKNVAEVLESGTEITSRVMRGQNKLKAGKKQRDVAKV